MYRIQEKTREQNDDPVAKASALMRSREAGHSGHPVRSTTMPAVSTYQTDGINEHFLLDEAKLPLPCWYFDYMVGTSTGGCVATF